MRIVSPRQICKTSALCWNAFQLGIAFFIPVMAILSVMMNTIDSASQTVRWIAKIGGILLMALGVIILPLLSLIRWRAQVLTLRRRLLASLCAAIGMLSLMLVISCIGAAHGEPQMLLVWIPIVAALACVWSLLAWPAWWWIRRTWPVTVQDGQTCPQCGYCLRGATSGRCPECGRFFNQFELGLSWDEFQKTKSAQ